MSQGALFPLKIKHHQPARGAGKDLRLEGIAEDGMEWALKRQAEHLMLPASEYLCYRLAQACALATPLDAVLIDTDGAPVFGSRIEAGLVELSTFPQPEAIQRIAACAGRMSACYALDLLLGNDDRHFGNFLFRKRSDGALACIVIDWSRAWWVRGWPPQQIGGRACATTTHMGILRSLGLWSVPEALLTLGTVSAIAVPTINRWLDDMPLQWLPSAERATLSTWWGSDAFHARINDCVAHCR
jgi:hypothetical protein